MTKNSIGANSCNLCQLPTAAWLPTPDRFFTSFRNDILTDDFRLRTPDFWIPTPDRFLTSFRNDTLTPVFRLLTSVFSLQLAIKPSLFSMAFSLLNLDSWFLAPVKISRLPLRLISTSLNDQRSGWQLEMTKNSIRANSSNLCQLPTAYCKLRTDSRLFTRNSQL